jgi:hypothetical protein
MDVVTALRGTHKGRLSYDRQNPTKVPDSNHNYTKLILIQCVWCMTLSVSF